MRTLIVEDDYITSQVMNEMFSSYGECDLAENGKIGIEKFARALSDGRPFDLVTLDIMMPEVDGKETLVYIREIEKQSGIKGLDCCKVIMTTALSDFNNINTAFKGQCDSYLIKPIEREKVEKALSDLKLL